jgi:hypothetical protein
LKVIHQDRNALFAVLHAAFQSERIKPSIAELGVHRGGNANQMYRALAPLHMVLIDSWNVKAVSAYSPFEELPPWVAPRDAVKDYYGGSLYEQSTYDKLYDECCLSFSGLSNVNILRYDTFEAIKHIKSETGIDKFDLIYIDANHQYEYVLRDLMFYQELVSDEGCIMLNDCCHSPNGVRLNLGVLEAVTSFLKRKPFRPIALTATDWSDLILARNSSKIGGVIDSIIAGSDIFFVEVPDQLLGAAKVAYGAKNNVNIVFV